MQERSDLEEFLSLVMEGLLSGARELFEKKYQFIDPSYRDKNQNTLMHFIVKAACEKFSLLLKQDNWGGQSQCLLDFQLLIKMMLQHGASWSDRNSEEKTPFNILTSYHIKASSGFFDMFNVFVEEVEKKEKILFPGRRYVYDMNLYRISKNPSKTCYIPDRWKMVDDNDQLDLTLHQRLAFYRVLLQQKFSYHPSKNLVVANLGFVVADKSKAEGDPLRKPVFLTFPIESEYLIFKPSSAGFDGHSEYSLCEFLLKKENLLQFVNKLREFGYGKGSKIYSVVIDFDSRRMVCLGCSSDLQKLAVNNQDDGFAKVFQSVFKTEYGENFQFPSKRRLPVIIRASGRNVHLSGRAMHEDDLFPGGMVYSEFNRNIKAHSLGTFLHLIPKIKASDEIYPASFKEKDVAFIEQSKVRAQEAIASFKGKKPFFFKGTSFQSAAGDHAKLVKEHGGLLSVVSEDERDYALGIALTI